jgi:hypothetical protein
MVVSHEGYPSCSFICQSGGLTRDQKHSRIHPTGIRLIFFSDATAVINGRNDTKAMEGKSDVGESFASSNCG